MTKLIAMGIAAVLLTGCASVPDIVRQAGASVSDSITSAIDQTKNKYVTQTFSNGLVQGEFEGATVYETNQTTMAGIVRRGIFEREDNPFGDQNNYKLKLEELAVDEGTLFTATDYEGNSLQILVAPDQLDGNEVAKLSQFLVDNEEVVGYGVTGYMGSPAYHAHNALRRRVGQEIADSGVLAIRVIDKPHYVRRR